MIVQILKRQWVRECGWVEKKTETRHCGRKWFSMKNARKASGWFWNWLPQMEIYSNMRMERKTWIILIFFSYIPWNERLWRYIILVVNGMGEWELQRLHGWHNTSFYFLKVWKLEWRIRKLLWLYSGRKVNVFMIKFHMNKNLVIFLL